MEILIHIQIFAIYSCLTFVKVQQGDMPNALDRL